MKANELRIGNYVRYFEENDSRIDGIEFNYCHLTDASSIYYEDIKPIPLTEDWLLKFGFKESTYGTFQIDGLFRTEIGNDNYDPVHEVHEGFKSHLVDIESNNISKEIKHVHQLQNLYFALTGEELEIKE